MRSDQTLLEVLRKRERQSFWYPVSWWKGHGLFGRVALFPVIVAWLVGKALLALLAFLASLP